jgi:hypothetical protein
MVDGFHKAIFMRCSSSGVFCVIFSGCDCRFDQRLNCARVGKTTVKTALNFFSGYFFEVRFLFVKFKRLNLLQDVARALHFRFKLCSSPLILAPLNLIFVKKQLLQILA